MIVSVMVSIAVSPITGAASFRRTSSRSSKVQSIFSSASKSAALTPCTFGSVPFVPVVIREAEARKRKAPFSSKLPIHTSVVEFPISTPAISFTFLPRYPSFFVNLRRFQHQLCAVRRMINFQKFFRHFYQFHLRTAVGAQFVVHL